MRTAGFVAVEITDVTDEYRDTVRHWIEQWDSSQPLRSLHGAEEFKRIQAERHRTVEAIDDDLLRRSLVVGSRRL